ncbi:MAG: DUF3800 domain-containing protein [Pseudomonadota bacterium]
MDESGHTGANLFDENQPILYYGVLSSKTNIDVLAEPTVRMARKIRGVERLHASELGLGGLVQISEYLTAIQKKYQPRFDIYRIAKADHAIICFFDQVFDQGMNPAMTWTGYWTPLRYVLLIKLASLFDKELAKSAWKARIDTNDATAESELVDVCQALLSRISKLPDARSRQLIGDSLRWAIDHPGELHYNCKSAKEVLTVTPNLIGFQTVMQGIASRLKNPKAFASITVDQQSQFNKAQRSLAEFYANARDVPWVSGPGLPQMDLSKIPTAPIAFRSSKECVGLELVDCYLWIFKRFLEGKEIAPELFPIIKAQLYRGRMDEVSLNAIDARWSRVFKEMPEPTEEQLQSSKEIFAKDEARRLRAVNPV